MSLPVFLVFAVAMVASALGVILSLNPVRSALSLVVTLFLLAVTFVFLEAHLVAALQVIVYAGAIMVLFLFVIMLLNLQQEPKDPARLGARAAAAIFAGGFVVWMTYYVLHAPDHAANGVVPPGFGTTEAIADSLFGKFLLPFEMTSVLMLVAIVGAVVLAKRKLT